MDETRFKTEFGKLSQRDFSRLSQFIYENFGIFLPDKKHYLLQNRLIPRLRELGFSSYGQYVDYVLNQGTESEEVFEMMNVVSTNKTEFFREKEHFTLLQQKLLPDFYGENIRVWSAGCSSGEEVYSLAMVLAEEKEAGHIPDFFIYGNDISKRILHKAIQAIYPYKEVESIPFAYRKKYLLRSKNKENPTIRIVPELRAHTRFLWENLTGNIETLPYDFQFVFCRNTLIYFDRETQNKVVTRLLKHLKPGGYLIVGHSESLLHQLPPGVKVIQPTVYQKIKKS
ncbi:chemotaxis protein CheR [Candidatus Sulfidibacterium hydrothermale]|uniref:CheR family methyltransferase n=1 Tax=Candidatus Sulfidibacterium hydrothermale TaxID=2875962 RepID=UPI001F0A650B|nr:CheR family methyltransferase [Candidatus Sulfidibacterium hydrothermale]UBM61867.1 chemotaxis protein CheR [Candidatus Sulfidibacterium hydrothermale]